MKSTEVNIINCTLCISMSQTEFAALVFLQRADGASDSFEVEVEKMNLQCPISGVKIVDPVALPGCSEVFDKRSVLEKIESGL